MNEDVRGGGSAGPRRPERRRAAPVELTISDPGYWQDHRAELDEALSVAAGGRPGEDTGGAGRAPGAHGGGSLDIEGQALRQSRLRL